ncbi:MAG: hypothetical protein HRU28_15040 [Rhizobiales bacterium]|nr:hypothetical protein [Hyphomicrobiales bacterium]
MNTKKYWYFVSFWVGVDGSFTVKTDEFLVDEPVTQIHQLDKFCSIELSKHNELQSCEVISYQLLREA